MTRAFIVFIAVVIGLVGPAVSAQTPVETDDDEVVRIDANLVTISAQVSDRNGRFISDLVKEDFQIFEDGVQQDLSLFYPVDEPFTILFLMDVSGGMYPHLAELARAGNAFLSQLRPDDGLIVFSFCDEVRTRAELGPVKETRGVKKIKLRTCGRYTFVYDAVHQALKRMKKVPGRKAVVLFSDGVSGERFSTAKSTLREAEEQEALIYSVQFGAFPFRIFSKTARQTADKTIARADEFMKGIAEKTGGRHYRVEDIADLQKTFGEVANELRRQYSLGYYPKIPLRQGQRRQLRVTLTRPGLVVRARNSYIALPREAR
ncbi:MAG TPA: VWA domain-containing protein [Pyrinomonadaceae bacterium]|nr:VWA domain-containing protein [Pyrinomonadaceae bacterium]